MDSETELGLDDVIAAVGRDLLKAREKALADPDGAFGLYVGTVEVELTLAVSRETSASGGAKAKVWVLPWIGVEASAEGRRSHAHQTTHRIKVCMNSHSLDPVGA
ncbi:MULTISPECIES: trypco2 family protein [unclassified Streptomyces]|uniref:trypco2 family protein n=1 Tax=unclassified Streptomyces TaxID=2593676 RepID=UPI0024A7C781|nr:MULTISPECIES: trypco2 family protein [unclassified Streptomyces]MDX3339702.1 hypothetical protein [Streptomyces sp. ME02-6979.5a]